MFIIDHNSANLCKTEPLTAEPLIYFCDGLPSFICFSSDGLIEKQNLGGSMLDESKRIICISLFEYRFSL
jgi:hypothetical protein